MSVACVVCAHIDANVPTVNLTDEFECTPLFFHALAWGLWQTTGNLILAVKITFLQFIEWD